MTGELRFKVGDAVEARRGDSYVPGKVTENLLSARRKGAGVRFVRNHRVLGADICFCSKRRTDPRTPLKSKKQTRTLSKPHSTYQKTVRTLRSQCFRSPRVQVIGHWEDGSPYVIELEDENQTCVLGPVDVDYFVRANNDVD